jgi:hypothetical protein
MLEPRADGAAVIRPQPTRCPSSCRVAALHHRLRDLTRACSMSSSGHTLQPFQLVGFNW